MTRALAFMPCDIRKTLRVCMLACMYTARFLKVLHGIIMQELSHFVIWRGVVQCTIVIEAESWLC